MPRHTTPKENLRRKWIAGHAELKTDGEVIFCTLCEKNIAATKKHHVLQHCTAPIHVSKKGKKAHLPHKDSHSSARQHLP